MTSSYFPVHAHSEYSSLDGFGTVADMVRTVASHGQVGMALTDHGNMSGVLKLYKHCMKEGIAPFPGSEFYLVTDHNDVDERGKRMHLGLLALDFIGYKALIRLSTLSHQQFYKKPIIDWANLIDLGDTRDHIACLTGCRSGPVVSVLMGDDDKNPTWNLRGAKAVTQRLSKLFKNTFVELQDHGINNDTEICENLAVVANELSLPIVAGQDSHYCQPEHQIAHDMMKSICYFGDSDDWKFDGGPYHLAHQDHMEKIFKKYWSRIEDGHEALLDLNRLSLPAMDKYHFHVPEIGGMATLKRFVANSLYSKSLDTLNSYKTQVSHELSVIESMGFWNYFILMRKLLGWSRDQGIFFNVRGSANGSLVCYLLGITNVDPIKWDLSFDRFLSLDRQKPPDIDVDIESDRRIEFIAHVKEIFPTMVPIGTYGRIGMTDELIDSDRKGSLIVQYHASNRRKDGYDGNVRSEDWVGLDLLSDMDARKSYGVHAAGYVLPAKSLPVNDYLSLMWVASSKQLVTQQVMEDVEDAGYVKGDFLGLRSLKTFRLCIEALGKDPVSDGMEWIPDDDPKACAILRSGRINTGIFQFEGFTTAKGGRELGVINTYDAIICLALYRPAMMNSGMTTRYLVARKNKKHEKLHPQIDPIMTDTWGVPVFQEQVINIMRSVGLNYQDLNDILKAVKASGGKINEYATATFNRIYPIFIQAAITNLNNCDSQTAETIWKTVMDFSDYGFNKAHATSYGLMAYRMAWLKAHHPLEFMAALLAAWAGDKKEISYAVEARRLNLTIGKTDINKSEIIWAIDKRMILRKGLLSIKGIGINAARSIVEERNANGPYTDMDDLISRVPARPVSGGKSWKKDKTLNGVLLRLQEVGALTSIGG